MSETKHPAKPKLTGAFDLIGKSWEVVQRNWKMFALLYLIPFLTVAGRVGAHPSNSWFGSRFESSGSFSGLPTASIVGLLGFGIVFAVALIIVSFFIRTMTYFLELEGAEHKTPSFQHLFDKARRYWLRMIGLLVIVGVMTVVGLILFIIPGLIVIRRYFLAPYIMIDQDVSITEAMQRSAELTKPYVGYIWSIIGVSFLISLINIVPYVGIFVAFLLAIVYSVAPAIRYLELKKIS